MKVLCMCRGGQVRSVGLKLLLRYRYGHDTLAAGHEGNSGETLELLFKWADHIVVLEEYMRELVPLRHRDRLHCYDVGPDTYGDPGHEELLQRLEKHITDHGLFVQEQPDRKIQDKYKET